MAEGTPFQTTVPFETIEEILRLAGQFEAMGLVSVDDRTVYEIAANLCRVHARVLATGSIWVGAEWERDKAA